MKITICRGDAPEASTYLADSSQPSRGFVFAIDIPTLNVEPTSPGPSIGMGTSRLP